MYYPISILSTQLYREPNTPVQVLVSEDDAVLSNSHYSVVAITTWQYLIVSALNNLSKPHNQNA